MLVQSCAHTANYCFSKSNRYSVADLAHILSPTALEEVIVRKRLDAARLTHREIAHIPFWVAKHILASRNSMVPSFQRLCRVVESAARVARIYSRPGLKDVVGNRRLGRIGRGFA